MLNLLQQSFWAIHQPTFERLKPAAISLLESGRDFTALAEAQRKKWESNFDLDYTRDEDGWVSMRSFKNAKDVAFIPLTGGMSKGGDLCSYGTRELSRQVMRANENNRISSIIIYCDTPGGTVDGTAEFASVIASSEKPILFFVDGMMCSAGLWAGVHSDYIMANSLNRNDIGSIGVLYMHVNQQKFIEDKIGSVTIYRSRTAPDKARINSVEPMTEQLEKSLLDELDEIHAEFMGVVSQYRGIAMDSPVMTGDTYTNKEALRLGLIDGLGTIHDAIAKAQSLAKTGSYKRKRNSRNQISTNTHMSLKKWLGRSAEEQASAEASVSATAEELSELRADMQATQTSLEQSQAQVTSLQAELSTAQAERDQARAERDQAQAEVSTLQAQLTAAKADLAKYGRQPGAMHQDPPKEKPEGGEGNGASEAQKTIDELPHNKALEGNPLFN